MHGQVRPGRQRELQRGAAGDRDRDAPKADQTITVTTHAPATAVFGTSFTVAATGGGSGNAVTFSARRLLEHGRDVHDDERHRDLHGQVRPGGQRELQRGDAGHRDRDAQKADQTITVTTQAPATAVYNTSFAVAATRAGGRSPSERGALLEHRRTFTMTSGTGTCTVKYDQAGNANYNAAPQVTETVNAVKASQTITVTTPAPARRCTARASRSRRPRGRRGLVLERWRVLESGATFTMTSGTGHCTVKYDQAGDDNYNAATQVTETVTAQKADQTITVTTHAPASAAYRTSSRSRRAALGRSRDRSRARRLLELGATFTMTSGTGPARSSTTRPATRTTTRRRRRPRRSTREGRPGDHGHDACAGQAVYGRASQSRRPGRSGNPVTFSSAGVCSNWAPTFTMTSGTARARSSTTRPANATTARRRR